MNFAKITTINIRFLCLTASYTLNLSRNLFFGNRIRAQCTTKCIFNFRREDSHKIPVNTVFVCEDVFCYLFLTHLLCVVIHNPGHSYLSLFLYSLSPRVVRPSLLSLSCNNKKELEMRSFLKFWAGVVLGSHFDFVFQTYQIFEERISKISKSSLNHTQSTFQKCFPSKIKQKALKRSS